MPFRLGEHSKELVRLWMGNLSDSGIVAAAERRLSWLYEENPDGPAQTWMAVTDPGEYPVGCGSFIPRSVRVGDQVIPTGVLADFAVDGSHRIGGAAVAIQRAIASSSGSLGRSFLYGWPNAKSVAVFKRIGYKVVGETTAWVKPLRTERFLRKRIPSDLVARFGGAVVDFAISVDDRRRLQAGDAVFRMEEQERADARFDDLWNRARFPWIVGKKTASYLNWRYADFPTARYRFLCLVERSSGNLEGYAIWSIVDGVAFVSDLLCVDLQDTMDYLLISLSRTAAREGAESVSLSFIGTDAFTRRLRRLRFVMRPTSRALVVYVGDPACVLTGKLLEQENWFMLDGELDI